MNSTNNLKRKRFNLDSSFTSRDDGLDDRFINLPENNINNKNTTMSKKMLISTINLD
jgi:hypothetical protein